MRDHHIRHLPVIDDYSLIGVISIRDIELMPDETHIALAGLSQPSAQPASPPQ